MLRRGLTIVRLEVELVAVGDVGVVGGVIEVEGVGDVGSVGLFMGSVSWGTALRCA